MRNESVRQSEMSHSGKRLKQTAIRRARKRERTSKQCAKDAKAFACGRKVIYMSEPEAQEVAVKLGAYFTTETPHICPVASDSQGGWRESSASAA